MIYRICAKPSVLFTLLAVLSILPVNEVYSQKKNKQRGPSCKNTIKLGFGDTTKPSDTRFAAQWCGSNRRQSRRRGYRNFVPGGGDRIFNNSLTPCTRVVQARLFCGDRFVSRANVRPGCPNNRSTFDFCAPNGGGARAIDALCRGKKMTVEVSTGRGRFCYNPPGANVTFRNGRIEPNRTR